MWAIVDLRWTRILAKQLTGKKVLEVGAGTGWLALALSQHGIDITAVDIEPRNPVFPIQRMNAVDAVKAIPADVLLMSWPEYDTPMAADTVKAFPGRDIVYIGELVGGCNADDEFFDLVEIKEGLGIPNWPCIHDNLFLMEKVVA